MIVSASGFGDTGSSAVTDFLLECKGNVQVFDYIEFTLVYMPDGLEDLEYHLMHRITRLSSSIHAIQKFHKAVIKCSREWNKRTGISYDKINSITDEFINNITQISFVGFSPMIDKKHNEFLRHYLGESIILHRIVPMLERKKIIKQNYNYYPLDEVKVSIKPENFYEESRKFVHNLLEAMGCDFSKKIILDQACAANDPAKSFPYFEDPYTIVVDRDPRDVFISARKYVLSKDRFFPTDTVENFIKYFKLVRDNQPYKDENPRILRINFEEMIYDYENVASKIEHFLNIENKAKRTIFIPEMSAANTRLWRKYPEFKREMALIESELAEYLFPFDSFDDIKAKGESFTDKSPLNARLKSKKKD